MSATQFADEFLVKGGMAQELRDGLRELANEMQATNQTPSEAPFFEWPQETSTRNAVKIECIPSMIGNGLQLEVGGFIYNVHGSLICALSQFITADLNVLIEDMPDVLGGNDTPVPVAGKTLVYRGRPYRIMDAERDPTGTYLKITLGSRNK